MRDSQTGTVLTSFAVGALSALLLNSFITKSKNREYAGATCEGNDLSLFYGDRKELTTITPSRKFLPKEIYGQLVLDTVVCCVDILLVRYNPKLKCKEFLLVERSTEPAKGYWWLPGGRLLKGETFFDAARRKARDETGLENVTPIQVLGVWNTFFPTSHWDTPTNKGTQTVNPIVLVELNEVGGDVKLDATSEEYKWVKLDPPAVKAAQDPYVWQAVYRLQEWDPRYISRKP